MQKALAYKCYRSLEEVAFPGVYFFIYTWSYYSTNECTWIFFSQMKQKSLFVLYIKWYNYVIYDELLYIIYIICISKLYYSIYIQIILFLLLNLNLTSKKTLWVRNVRYRIFNNYDKVYVEIFTICSLFNHFFTLHYSYKQIFYYFTI